MSARPLVTIVTPTLNQGAFIRQTIESVFAQGYPRIEYIVVDGGSNDATLDVLRSYGERLRWVSEPDSGQAAAINKGFALGRGEILAWLNSDDTLLPDAVEHAVAAFERAPGAGVIYGRGLILDEAGRVLHPFAGIEPFFVWRLLHCLCFVLQPACFFRRSHFLEAGGLDEGLHYGLDWDLWIRLAERTDVRFLDRELACSREYAETKTTRGGWRRIQELGEIARRHTGDARTPGVRLYALDTWGNQMLARAPRWLHTPIELLRTLRKWRVWRSLPVHDDGWMGPRSELLLPARWRAARVLLELPRVPRRGMRVRFLGAAGALGEVRAHEPGVFEQRWLLPRNGEPFVRVRVESDASFRSHRLGPRLSLRCLEVERGDTGGAP